MPRLRRLKKVLKHILRHPPSAPGQCDAVPVCSHGGSDGILHGRQKVQDGVLGSSSLTGGQTHTGGAEHPAGGFNIHTHTHIRVSCNNLYCLIDGSQDN